MIEIQPPLQIVYLGNGCEGYSPSMFLPAKNEMTTHAQIESCREYFLQFNYVYTPDRYIGLWWQFRMRMMSKKEARAFITQVAPFGTMDYSLLHKRPPMIKTNYGFSWPVPPTTLIIGVVVVILLVAGIVLGCYVYWMGKTFKLVMGTVKQVTKKTRYISTYHTMTKDYQRCAQSPCSRDSPGVDDENLEGRFPGPSTSPQIRETPGQEGAGRLLCITGARDCSQSREFHRHSVPETYFQKLSEKAISPHQATPGSVGYDLFTPVDLLIQPNKQKTVFLDLAVTPPEGYYAQLMSKLGLMVLYELEAKAGVIDPDFTGNIGVVLKNNSDQPIERLAGKQIAQLLFIKVATPILVQVTSLARTEWGEYGFGAHTN